MRSKVGELIKNSQEILVFSGAGISTSSGIPDFRGPEGLYAKSMELYKLPFPEAVFEINWFLKHPEPFFKFSADLFALNPQPSPAHRALVDLEQGGKRVKVVTQNIDMLHEEAGSQDVMACHGSYRVGHCLACRREALFVEYQEALKAGEVVRCPECGGVVKPDIVFFGENLPGEFYQILRDPPRVDLVLVLGTSLTVQPAASLPLTMIRSGIPGVLVNLSPTPYDELFDFVINEPLDQIVPDLVG